MAVNIPAAINLMTSDPDSVKRSNIGSPVSVSKKSAGNLPITEDASQYISNQQGDTAGILWDMASVDASANTKLLVLSWQFNAPNRIQCDTMSNSGIIMRIGSGSGNNNYKEYKVGGNDTPTASSQAGPVPVVIDLNDNSNESSSGTFDNTDIQTYGHGTKMLKISGNSNSWVFFQRVHIFDTLKDATNIVKFTGTSAYEDIIAAVLGSSYLNKIGTWVQKLSNTYFVPVAFQIGDTSTLTNFNDNGAGVVSPLSADPSDPRYRLTTQGTRVYVSLRDNASDSCILSGTYSWGVASPWDINVSNASSVTIQGATFSGMGQITLGSSVIGASTFNLASGSSVVSNGSNIDGSIINGDLEINDNRNYSNVTVNGNVRINTGANDTVSYSNFKWSGDLTNTSSNTLTINTLDGTAGTTSESGTGNGQVNLAAPAKSLTISVNQTGFDVVILQAGTNTVLAEVDNESGTSFNWVYSGAQSIDVGVIKQGFIINYIYGFSLSGENTTLPITLITDRNYV